MGALAAAAGFSQVEASKIMDAMAYSSAATNMGSVYKGTFGKPRVVWLHGAECTGCSTSLLGIFENAGGAALYNNNGSTFATTATALTLAQTLPTSEAPAGGLLYHELAGPGVPGASKISPDPTGSIDIADVVVDVIDLLYHETVMGMGGDTAYKWLNDFKTTNNKPFILVVEGALQATANGGAWNNVVADVPWCSIAADGTSSSTTAATEIVTAEIVSQLGNMQNCVLVVAIGQCATFGGYPGCRPPLSTTAAGFDTSKSQTDAMGTFDYLNQSTVRATYAYAADKVVNVPGCPTNPWWFVLSIVAAMVDLESILIGGQSTGSLGILKGITAAGAAFPGTNGAGNLGIGIASTNVDGTRRIKSVYGNPIHGPYCPRYRYFVQGQFAAKPGDTGCLQLIGCKGPAAMSLCGVHGWNGQQPTNPSAWDDQISTANLAPDGVTPTGGHCTRAGHPCMACTEKGYPDNFVPFVVRS
jgi:Ni,Fe-hydrogenase I small subunit